MGIFDSMKDNMERRQRTREYIKAAKEYIKDGEELYANAYEKVMRRAEKTNRVIEKHIDYKKKVAKTLGEDILPVINNVHIPNIAVDIDPPFIDGKKAGLTDFSVSFANCVSMNPVPIPSIMDIFVSEEDYWEARNQRDEAKAFKQQMKYERECLYAYRDKMSVIEGLIGEERQQIDDLLDKLDKITNKMKSFKSTNEEIEYVRAMKKISEGICKLLTADFLKENLDISADYKNILEGIEQINCAIPNANSISESQIKEIAMMKTGW